jgi:hypothetical protein
MSNDCLTFELTGKMAEAIDSLVEELAVQYVMQNRETAIDQYEKEPSFELSRLIEAYDMVLGDITIDHEYYEFEEFTDDD